MTPEGTRRNSLYYADAWHPFWHARVNGRGPGPARQLLFSGVRGCKRRGNREVCVRSGTLSGASTVAESLLISTILAVVSVAVYQVFHP